MSKYFVIGTIVATHALKGEVKILSTTDFSDERYKVGNKLYINLDKEMVEVIVRTHRVHKEYDLVSFEDYDDINKVLPFVKSKIYVNDEDIEPLEDEDEFYYHELFECNVYHQDKYIGKVIDVVNYGASDILIVQRENKQEEMIPFVDDFIVDVDIENKKIQIEVIEGLLSDED